MIRLKYRRLLMSTVILLAPITYGAGGDQSNSEDSSTAYTSKTAERPNEHFCPITHAPMQDPMVAEDGYSYEKEAILTWFASKKTSPMTNKPINTTLYCNHKLKVLIQEWKPSQVYTPSALAELSAEEIIKVLDIEFTKTAHLLQPEYTAEGKDIVVFLGNTGAGKSTLINFLSGKELNVADAGYALSNPSDQSAFSIGGDLFQSETHYPKSIDVKTLRLFDLPGFMDSGGALQNLLNAAFIRNILMEAKSVRCVYVAGEDQFTADKGASIEIMTKAIQQLFVMKGENTDPVNQGLFVVTKSNQLLESAITKNYVSIPKQIMTWHTNGRIDRMYHTKHHDKNNAEHRVHLLGRIEELPSLTLSTLNFSALYPPETAYDLERMYSKMFQDAYAKKKETPITTISEYQKHIEAWDQESFWEDFESVYFIETNPLAPILRDISIIPYNKAKMAFLTAYELDRKEHILTLKEGKENRCAEIMKSTKERSETVAKKLRAEGLSPFDSKNENLCWDRVCGLEAIKHITTDDEEQEIVRNVFRPWWRESYERELREARAEAERQARAEAEREASAEAERRRLTFIPTGTFRGVPNGFGLTVVQKWNGLWWVDTGDQY